MFVLIWVLTWGQNSVWCLKKREEEEEGSKAPQVQTHHCISGTGPPVAKAGRLEGCKSRVESCFDVNGLG